MSSPPGDLASSLSPLTKAGEDVETSLPTRFLILLPATDAIMQKVESMPHARKVMSFAAGSLPLGDPSAYRWPYSQMEMFRCGDAMVLVQVENAEAAAMYPVHGKQLADRLSRWENRWRMDKCLNIVGMPCSLEAALWVPQTRRRGSRRARLVP